MTETTTTTQATNQTENEKIIFLYDTWNENQIIAARERWFKRLPICEIYNSYGQHDAETLDEHEETEGECCHETALIYNFHDGSNMKSAVLDVEGGRYESIEDDELIVKLQAAVDSKKYAKEATGYKIFSAPGYTIRASSWQGDWELYQIIPNDQESE